MTPGQAKTFFETVTENDLTEHDFKSAIGALAEFTHFQISDGKEAYDQLVVHRHITVSTSNWKQGVSVKFDTRDQGMEDKKTLQGLWYLIGEIRDKNVLN